MNPIELRVYELQARWETFLDTEKKCLRWLADPNEGNVVDGFVELQAEEHEYHAGDVFFPFYFAFENDEQFVDELLEEMEIAVEVAKKELAEEAFEVKAWNRTEREEKTPREWFSESVVSFTENLSENLRHLVLYFHASDVANQKLYVEFLSEVIDHLPVNAKMLLLDHAHEPMAPGFDVDERIETDVLALDMNQAYREIAQSGGGEGPEYEFRNHLVLANEYAANGYNSDFVSTIDQLLAIVKKEGWLQQSIAVHMLAAGVAASGNTEKMFYHYTLATDVAVELSEQNDDLAPLLTYQTHMAFGSAILAQKNPDLALALEKFSKSAKAADTCSETTRGLYLIEAWRMTGYVQQLAKNPEGTWEALWKSHAAADLLPEEMNPGDTTLVEVGKGLVSLTKDRNGWFSGAPCAEHHDEVMEAFDSLLGEGWLQESVD